MDKNTKDLEILTHSTCALPERCGRLVIFSISTSFLLESLSESVDESDESLLLEVPLVPDEFVLEKKSNIISKMDNNHTLQL